MLCTTATNTSNTKGELLPALLGLLYYAQQFISEIVSHESGELIQTILQVYNLI